MKERIAKAPDLFLVAADKANDRLVGFLNGLATDEYSFRDVFLRIRIYTSRMENLDNKGVKAGAGILVT